MSESSTSEDERQIFLMQMAGMAIAALAVATVEYASPLYDKTPYHTSVLSGADWVLELIDGHPERIRCELGVYKHVFHALIAYLQI